MEAFLETTMMKAHRKSYLHKEIIVGILFLLFCIIGPLTFNSNWILLMFAFFYLTVEGLLLTKYLSYPCERTFRGFLASVMKYHAFDTEAYFQQIAKKLAVTELVMAAGFSISMAVYQRTVMVPAVVLLLAAPFLLYLLVKGFFKYCLVNDLSVGVKVAINLIYGFSLFVSVIVLFVYGLGVVIVGYGIVSDALNVQKVSQDVVAYYVYQSSMAGVMIILCALFAVSQLYLKGSKFMKYASMALLVLFFLSMVGSLAMERANHTVITEQKIIHTSNFQVTEYGYDDVAKVKVSMGNDQMNVDLLMKDGEEIPVVAGTYSNTEAFNQKYDSLYSFLSDLTGKLLAQGAEGSITDVSAIREFVKDYDPVCVKGTEEIIAMLQ